MMNRTIEPEKFKITIVGILYDEQTMEPGNFKTSTIVILYDEQNHGPRKILILLL